MKKKPTYIKKGQVCNNCMNQKSTLCICLKVKYYRNQIKTSQIKCIRVLPGQQMKRGKNNYNFQCVKYNLLEIYFRCLCLIVSLAYCNMKNSHHNFAQWKFYFTIIEFMNRSTSVGFLGRVSEAYFLFNQSLFFCTFRRIV